MEGFTSPDLLGLKGLMNSRRDDKAFRCLGGNGAAVALALKTQGKKHGIFANSVKIKPPVENP